MLDFLWHMGGVVAVRDDAGDQEVIERISAYLREQGKFELTTSPFSIEYESSLIIFPGSPREFWRPRVPAMYIYNRGQFRIIHADDERHVVYDLSSLHGFLFCLSAGFVFLAFGLATSRDLVFAVCLGAGALVWLYGVNQVLARFRVPAALRKAISGA